MSYPVPLLQTRTLNRQGRQGSGVRDPGDPQQTGCSTSPQSGPDRRETARPSTPGSTAGVTPPAHGGREAASAVAFWLSLCLQRLLPMWVLAPAPRQRPRRAAEDGPSATHVGDWRKRRPFRSEPADGRFSVLARSPSLSVINPQRKERTGEGPRGDALQGSRLSGRTGALGAPGPAALRAGLFLPSGRLRCYSI